MNYQSDVYVRAMVGLLIVVAWIVLSCCFVVAAHFLLTLPMRRAERARLFLDLLDSSIKQGRPIEETIISLAQSRDLSMGPGFHLVAAWLEQNLSLTEAVAKVPRFLPPQVNAMLSVGRDIGDFRKVLPACRQLLKDSVSQIRGAINYLVILTFVITPVGIFIAETLKVLVLPKFMEIGQGSLGEGVGLKGLDFVFRHFGMIAVVQGIVLVLLWVAAIVYLGGPRLVSWFPILQRLHYWMPWRRKRMQRDFSSLLAILLDSGVPEPEAITLAASCTANAVFRKRAARAVNSLKQGRKLTEAVQVMDDSGEFGWRLANAFHGGGGFFKALAGWHESLDAKAFQEEQGAAHGITSALVLWSGLFVGIVVVSVFMFLTSIINQGVLW